MSVRSRVAFFEQFGSDEAAASSGKRAREVESITSPGIVRETKEKLLSPAAREKQTRTTEPTNATASGKVRQSVETITNGSRIIETNTPPSKRQRTSAAELVMQDLSKSTPDSPGKVQQCVDDLETSNTSISSATTSSPNVHSPPKNALRADASEQDAEALLVKVAEAPMKENATGEEKKGVTPEETGEMKNDTMAEEKATVEEDEVAKIEAPVAHEAEEKEELSTCGFNGLPPPSPAPPVPTAGPPPAPACSSQRPSSHAPLVAVAEDGVLAETDAIGTDAADATNAVAMHTATTAHIKEDGAVGQTEEAAAAETSEAEAEEGAAKVVASPVGSVGSTVGSACSPAEKARRALIMTRSLDNSTRSGKRRRASEAPDDLPA